MFCFNFAHITCFDASIFSLTWVTMIEHIIEWTGTMRMTATSIGRTIFRTRIERTESCLIWVVMRVMTRWIRSSDYNFVKNKPCLLVLEGGKYPREGRLAETVIDPLVHVDEGLCEDGAYRAQAVYSLLDGQPSKPRSRIELTFCESLTIQRDSEASLVYRYATDCLLHHLWFHCFKLLDLFASSWRIVWIQGWGLGLRVPFSFRHVCYSRKKMLKSKLLRRTLARRLMSLHCFRLH